MCKVLQGTSAEWKSNFLVANYGDCIFQRQSKTTHATRYSPEVHLPHKLETLVRAYADADIRTGIDYKVISGVTTV